MSTPTDRREFAKLSARYRTTPDPQETRMPRGVPYIVGNEAAERFSFYGMRTILYVFMTEHLTSIGGESAVMDIRDATIWQHNFMTAAYFFPLLGAFLCDTLLGKYRTILWLSILYCVGHAVMALVDLPHLTGVAPQAALWWALALIAFSTGGIKPCVSAHVGDQFGAGNQRLMSRVYLWFYFSINLGATASTLLTPELLRNFGPGVAFGVPGVLMAIATLVFWLGRNEYVHVPPAGIGFFREALSREGIGAVAKLIPLFLLLAVFWCLFDQTTSTWVEQAKNMDRNVFGYEIEASAHQAANPILVMLLIPLFTQVVYPLVERRLTLTPLRRIGVGLAIAPFSYFIIAGIQSQIDAGATPHLSWQTLAYVVITASEVLLSVTALEFAYTQAPPKMKSFVTGIYWLSVALGNEMIVLVNSYIKEQQAAGSVVLEGADYFRFFAYAMSVTALIYLVWAATYRGSAYLQEAADPADSLVA
ncbi:POT family MFS transporter [Botrimarina hoheduenensis]|uniref:Dipeptide and tripeptide permease A n=1 Tax=Botrimarina hoheduenensis TaxID=2528000 RepID=A0A5C5WED7_9BACT|nr:POT family MFS transporter [Botrimarina hoheduenensis]TWT48431.1 Dipeptide and tripeptide permease A [Botrimarina hoheduenensis]